MHDVSLCKRTAQFALADAGPKNGDEVQDSIERRKPKRPAPIRLESPEEFALLPGYLPQTQCK
jgi:hypothetical protein